MTISFLTTSENSDLQKTCGDHYLIDTLYIEYLLLAQSEIIFIIPIRINVLLSDFRTNFLASCFFNQSFATLQASVRSLVLTKGRSSRLSRNIKTIV